MQTKQSKIMHMKNNSVVSEGDLQVPLFNFSSEKRQKHSSSPSRDIFTF